MFACLLLTYQALQGHVFFFLTNYFKSYGLLSYWPAGSTLLSFIQGFFQKRSIIASGGGGG